MSEEEKKKIHYSDLPEGIRKFIASEQGRKTIKYFAENPGTLETAARATELHKKARQIIARNPEIQKAIQIIAEKILTNRRNAHNLLKKQVEAAQNVALSGSIGEYYKNQQAFYNLLTDNTHIAANISSAHPSDKNAKVPDEKKEEWEAVVSYLESLLGSTDKINNSVDRFLRKFQVLALKNEKSSAKNACWSLGVAIAAIVISVVGILASGGIQWYFAWRAEKNDKTGELIEVVKKSHPWSEQQISSEDAKNVRVAFQAITEALQKNMQLEKDNIQLKQEPDRLQADLKKAQDTLSGLEKKYNVATAGFALEKQKLYAEIAALKKQIEKLELKIELIKRPLPQFASRQEAKNE